MINDEANNCYYFAVKLRLNKQINIKPIYQLKSCILGKIRNQRVKKKQKKQENKIVLENLYIFFDGREKLLTLLKAKYLSQNLRVQEF